ncbi:hypothetical protein CCZ01_04450 [Helicobacter monodelphidis]|uniref:C40 family peptidase n=1 Tax=Helicobacter sp. 15-1451 TaxID=2004995 RepID=UPI000DCC80F2|nr:SH3 domain-containing C40 family peptidase [Helicobacter sp. 15-1451]RAX57884.1 hypothetical protein CCZ01_04450 [Helicobacter sp. 15-1451]
MKFIIFIPFFFVFLMFGCSSKESTLTPQQENLGDIKHYPQEVRLFLKNLNWELSAKAQQELASDYRTRMFEVWNRKKPFHTKKDLLFPSLIAQKDAGFGENNLPNSTHFINTLNANINAQNYPNTFQAGILIQDTSLRLMPTFKPRFLDSNIAGEGYPFDHWQNSSAYALTPILIIHTSADKQWFFVESSFVGGWVHSSTVAFVSKKDQNVIKQGKLLVSLQEEIPLYSKDKYFIDKTRIGKIFLTPKIIPNAKQYTLLIPTANFKKELDWHKISAPKEIFAPFPLRWNAKNIESVTQQLLGQKYGWGGLFENRDCSAFLRDIFGTFGIWLPRNSAAQATTKNLTGDFISLSQIEPTQKESMIIQNGLAWGSLIWLKGHIMLYLGEYEGKAVVLHSIWGLRTLDENQKEGRFVIGGSLISDLYLGQELPNIDTNMLLKDRILGIKNLFSPQQIQGITIQ